MPMIFIGHGSPIFALGKNEFSANWSKLGKIIPKPKGILAISAHWSQYKTYISFNPTPKTIHDFKGFPEELYKINYVFEGDTNLSNRLFEIFDGEADYAGGRDLDHGVWAPLIFMYPEINIPVTQISLNVNLSTTDIFNIGRRLKPLREEGILILASGNIVHNIEAVDYDKKDGFSWADDFDNYIQNKILRKQYEDVVRFERAGDSAKEAFKTLEHFYPLIYLLGATGADDKVKFFNNKRIMGGISMTSYLFDGRAEK